MGALSEQERAGLRVEVAAEPGRPEALHFARDHLEVAGALVPVKGADEHGCNIAQAGAERKRKILGADKQGLCHLSQEEG